MAESTAVPPLSFLLNQAAAHRPVHTQPLEPVVFHRRLPGYRPTPVVPLTRLAARLGVGELWAKLEDDRFGLPSFKVLGASWAVHQALRTRTYGAPRPETLVTATDGNHGRAVAWVARQHQLAARVLVPQGTIPRRIEAIRAEGATVIEFPGSYDEAVEAAASSTGPAELLVADTSVDPADRTARWIVDGYSTLFVEAAEQHPAPFDAIVVGVGVGSLAAATVRYASTLRPASGRPTAVLGVEPSTAACLLASLRAGKPTAVAGPHDSVMAGLNCGQVSAPAWPALRTGVNGVCAVDDQAARAAVRELAADGVEVGYTGAAPLAGLLRLAEAGALTQLLPAPATSSLLLVLTEGQTD